MTSSEFYLIQRYFARQTTHRAEVLLGIGDDAALVDVPPGETLAVTVDTLVAGVHFLPDAAPAKVGHKALAVNLSDLAAMGARPAWVTLALSLPACDETWLAAFCDGFFTLAERFRVQLVGGDTTRGPLTICVQANGFVPRDQALRRDGARPGDVVLLTGTPGDAGLAFALARGRVQVPKHCRAYLQDRLDQPMPRVSQGLDLRGLASAAIDVSDGLAQDLGHILRRSQVGASLYIDRLPRSPGLAACLDESEVLAAQLSGGDDYELCFTVAPRQLGRVRELAAGWDCRCTEIGIIEEKPGLRCLRKDGTLYNIGKSGYDHFA